jgi:Kef-type K+ transport system membrane component KefB
MPGIIGLIVSGVILGPNGFNVLEKSAAIQLFSTIGLLYIMFIAGLELDMKEFKQHQNRSILFGFLTFIIPISIGFPVCRYLLDYNFNASLLTASMFATHTLVSYPITHRYGISKHPVVAVSVGGTILTDTAVLIMLAVIVKNFQGKLNYSFITQLVISLVLFALIMFFIVPRIAQWFFRKLESEKHAHYIFVLSVVFFAAFLAEVAGVEPIIGAFVAGLALNKLIPHSSALMNRIEFIGNSLFIPFFLISVGMIVDLRVLSHGYTALIVAGALTVVAILGKWLAALLTQWIAGYSRTERQLMFGLSNAHAAATLAIILVGFNEGILDKNILNGTIVLILITCIVASFATEGAAKEMVISGEHNPNTQSSAQTISESEHILVPKSKDDDFDKNLELALMIKDADSPNPISILSVVPNDTDAEANIRKTKAQLEVYSQFGSATETPVNTIATIDHNEPSAISRISREILADILIVEWPEKNDIIDKVVGDKGDGLLQNADKTILVSDIKYPLVATKRVVVLAPPFCENEIGFGIWMDKLSRLTQELSVEILLYSSPRTHKIMRLWSRKNKLNLTISHKELEDWNDVLVISQETHRGDLLFIISARKGFVSHHGSLDSLLPRIDKYFDSFNKIILYPKQHETSLIHEAFEDISSGPISKGIESIGKGLSTLFRFGKKVEED